MRLFNSLTRQKDDFRPIAPGRVSIYACGPTVYNYFHLGNARPFVVFDTLRRYFEYGGYKVNFVQNFTDIDDKMINRANEEAITVAELAERFIAEYYTDAQGLGIKEASTHPRATENIDAIISLITKLIDGGYAYESGGDVYYSTKKFESYGKLSHQPLEDLEMGARIETTDLKRDAMDFVLWKAQKPGEPAWESPWGMGRPGWHIECSAMAGKYLGETIDIHCGGQDLMFPHHENEIAQSEAATGKPFANYWVHNGYINIDNQKMSKSTGNFFTVRDIAEKMDYEVIRFFLLSAHYRSPVNFSADLLEQSKSALERLYTCRDNLAFLQKSAEERRTNSADDTFISDLGACKAEFIAAMDDDINTAGAIGALFEMVKAINIATSAETPAASCIEYALTQLQELGGILGILQKETTANTDSELEASIEALIAKRAEAKKNRDFAAADAIRDELLAMNVVIEDTRNGVKWKYTTEN